MTPVCVVSGLKGLLDASSGAGVQPPCAEIAKSAFDFFAELSQAVNSPATQASPTSLDTPPRVTVDTDSNSNVVNSKAAASKTTTADSSADAAKSDDQRHGAVMTSDEIESATEQQQKHGLFSVFKRHSRHAKEEVPMGHALTVHRCDHLSSGAKVVLNMVRLMRKRSAVKRAGVIKKAQLKSQGAYQWGGSYIMFPSKTEKGEQQGRIDAAKAENVAAESDNEDLHVDLLEYGAASGLNIDADSSNSSRSGNSEVPIVDAEFKDL